MPFLGSFPRPHKPAQGVTLSISPRGDAEAHRGQRNGPPRAQEGQSWGSENDSTLPEAAVPLCLPSPSLKLHTGGDNATQNRRAPKAGRNSALAPLPTHGAETPPLRKIILVVECKGTARAGGERQAKKSKSDRTAKLKWDIFPRV